MKKLDDRELRSIVAGGRKFTCNVCGYSTKSKIAAALHTAFGHFSFNQIW